MLEVGMKVKVKDGSEHEGFVRGFMPRKATSVLVDGYENGHDGGGLHDVKDCQWLWDEVLEEVKE